MSGFSLAGLSMAHLIVAPVLLPLAAAGLLAGMGAQRRRVKATISLVSCVLMLATAVALLLWVDGQDAPGAIGVYLPGNWPVPFGIVLAVDRLSALMLVLSAVTGLASLLFSLARWHRAGVHFLALLQMQLMGLNGAFLTADLFNLFVFFEVLLAASYGLLLHGGGSARVRAGLHYIAINLFASLLFLIGVALLYGVTGTLNMADLAAKLPSVPASDRGLLHAGAALLGVAFLAKAAIWPMNFWLPPAYAAASTPVAAIFAVLTKVGVYSVLRLWTLCFPSTAGDSALFGSEALVWGGLLTLAFGTVGMLASQSLARVVAFSIIASSGTVVAATGFDHPALTTGALFYLASATLAAAAMFLMVELMDRARAFDRDLPSAVVVEEQLPGFGEMPPAPADANLDDVARAADRPPDPGPHRLPRPGVPGRDAGALGPAAPVRVRRQGRDALGRARHAVRHRAGRRRRRAVRAADPVGAAGRAGPLARGPSCLLEPRGPAAARPASWPNRCRWRRCSRCASPWWSAASPACATCGRPPQRCTTRSSTSAPCWRPSRSRRQ